MGSTICRVLVVGGATVHVASFGLPSIVPRHGTTARSAVATVWEHPPAVGPRIVDTRDDQVELEMVATLRRLFGRSGTVWGDLDAKAARTLYVNLLPRVLVDEDQNDDDDNKYCSSKKAAAAAIEESDEALRRLQTRAQAAALARRAAKRYVRERSLLPLRLLALAVDGARHGSLTGASIEYLEAKYFHDARARLGRRADDDAVYRLAYETLLRKSCETNTFFDELFLEEHYAAPRASKPWRLSTRFSARNSRRAAASRTAKRDAREAAWSAFLLNCALVKRPQKKTKVAPVVRAKWIRRNLRRTLKREL